MAIPEYCVVGQLPHVEDVYLVTRNLTLPDDYVLVLKYTGSAFLYPVNHSWFFRGAKSNCYFNNLF